MMLCPRQVSGITGRGSRIKMHEASEPFIETLKDTVQQQPIERHRRDESSFTLELNSRWD